MSEKSKYENSIRAWFFDEKRRQLFLEGSTTVACISTIEDGVVRVSFESHENIQENVRKRRTTKPPVEQDGRHQEQPTVLQHFVDDEKLGASVFNLSKSSIVDPDLCQKLANIVIDTGITISGTTPVHARVNFADETSKSVAFRTAKVICDIQFSPFVIRWTCVATGKSLCNDIDNGKAYSFSNGSFTHYLQKHDESIFWGFGESTGLNREGQRIRLDPKGKHNPEDYDAAFADPLCKAHPWYITFRPEMQQAYGIMYDISKPSTSISKSASHSSTNDAQPLNAPRANAMQTESVFDIGKERDATISKKPYMYFQSPGLPDYYFVAGPSFVNVSQRLALLTGRACRVPRFGLGLQIQGVGNMCDNASSKSTCEGSKTEGNKTIINGYDKSQVVDDEIANPTVTRRGASREDVPVRRSTSPGKGEFVPDKPNFGCEQIDLSHYLQYIFPTLPIGIDDSNGPMVVDLSGDHDKDAPKESMNGKKNPKKKQNKRRQQQVEFLHQEVMSRLNVFPSRRQNFLFFDEGDGDEKYVRTHRGELVSSPSRNQNQNNARNQSTERSAGSSASGSASGSSAGEARRSLNLSSQAIGCVGSASNRNGSKHRNDSADRSDSQKQADPFIIAASQKVKSNSKNKKKKGHGESCFAFLEMSPQSEKRGKRNWNKPPRINPETGWIESTESEGSSSEGAVNGDQGSATPTTNGHSHPAGGITGNVNPSSRNPSRGHWEDGQGYDRPRSEPKSEPRSGPTTKEDVKVDSSEVDEEDTTGVAGMLRNIRKSAGKTFIKLAKGATSPAGSNGAVVDGDILQIPDTPPQFARTEAANLMSEMNKIINSSSIGIVDESQSASVQSPRGQLPRGQSPRGQSPRGPSSPADEAYRKHFDNTIGSRSVSPASLNRTPLVTNRTPDVTPSFSPQDNTRKPSPSRPQGVPPIRNIDEARNTPEVQGAAYGVAGAEPTQATKRTDSWTEQFREIEAGWLHFLNSDRFALGPKGEKHDREVSAMMERITGAGSPPRRDVAEQIPNLSSLWHRDQNMDAVPNPFTATFDYVSRPLEDATARARSRSKEETMRERTRDPRGDRSLRARADRTSPAANETEGNPNRDRIAELDRALSRDLRKEYELIFGTKPKVPAVPVEVKPPNMLSDVKAPDITIPEQRKPNTFASMNNNSSGKRLSLNGGIVASPSVRAQAGKFLQEIGQLSPQKVAQQSQEATPQSPISRLGLGYWPQLGMRAPVDAYSDSKRAEILSVQRSARQNATDTARSSPADAPISGLRQMRSVIIPERVIFGIGSTPTAAPSKAHRPRPSPSDKRSQSPSNKDVGSGIRNVTQIGKVDVPKLATQELQCSKRANMPALDIMRPLAPNKRAVNVPRLSQLGAPMLDVQEAQFSSRSDMPDLEMEMPRARLSRVGVPMFRERDPYSFYDTTSQSSSTKRALSVPRLSCGAAPKPAFEEPHFSTLVDVRSKTPSGKRALDAARLSQVPLPILNTSQLQTSHLGGGVRAYRLSKHLLRTPISAMQHRLGNHLLDISPSPERKPIQWNLGISPRSMSPTTYVRKANDGCFEKTTEPPALPSARVLSPVRAAPVQLPESEARLATAKPPLPIYVPSHAFSNRRLPAFHERPPPSLDAKSYRPLTQHEEQQQMKHLVAAENRTIQEKRLYSSNPSKQSSGFVFVPYPSAPCAAQELKRALSPKPVPAVASPGCWEPIAGKRSESPKLFYRSHSQQSESPKNRGIPSEHVSKQASSICEFVSHRDRLSSLQLSSATCQDVVSRRECTAVSGGHTASRHPDPGRHPSAGRQHSAGRGRHSRELSVGRQLSASRQLICSRQSSVGTPKYGQPFRMGEFVRKPLKFFGPWKNSPAVSVLRKNFVQKHFSDPGSPDSTVRSMTSHALCGSLGNRTVASVSPGCRRATNELDYSGSMISSAVQNSVLNVQERRNSREGPRSRGHSERVRRPLLSPILSAQPSLANCRTLANAGVNPFLYYGEDEDTVESPVDNANNQSDFHYYSANNQSDFHYESANNMSDGDFGVPPALPEKKTGPRNDLTQVVSPAKVDSTMENHKKTLLLYQPKSRVLNPKLRHPSASPGTVARGSLSSDSPIIKQSPTMAQSSTMRQSRSAKQSPVVKKHLQTSQNFLEAKIERLEMRRLQLQRKLMSQSPKRKAMPGVGNTVINVKPKVELKKEESACPARSRRANIVKKLHTKIDSIWDDENKSFIPIGGIHCDPGTGNWSSGHSKETNPETAFHSCQSANATLKEAESSQETPESAGILKKLCARPDVAIQGDANDASLVLQEEVLEDRTMDGTTESSNLPLLEGLSEKLAGMKKESIASCMIELKEKCKGYDDQMQFYADLYSHFSTVFKAPFLQSVSGCLGAQRYISQTSSGKPACCWKSLRYLTGMGLHLSLSNFPFYGHDNRVPVDNSELFLRWVQNSVFTPRFCLHDSRLVHKTIPSLYKEENAQMIQTLVALTKAVSLRYKLIPYLQSCCEQASIIGIPIVRPLVFDFPSDQKVHENYQDFMLGDSLHVCSVVTENASSRSVYLPQSSADDYWYNFLTGEGPYRGGTTLNNVDCDLDSVGVPVFVRAGSIIPMDIPLDNVENVTQDGIIPQDANAKSTAAGSAGGHRSISPKKSATPNARFLGPVNSSPHVKSSASMKSTKLMTTVPFRAKSTSSAAQSSAANRFSGQSSKTMSDRIMTYVIGRSLHMFHDWKQAFSKASNPVNAVGYTETTSPQILRVYQVFPKPVGATTEQDQDGEKVIAGGNLYAPHTIGKFHSDSVGRNRTGRGAMPLFLGSICVDSEVTQVKVCVTDGGDMPDGLNETIATLKFPKGARRRQLIAVADPEGSIRQVLTSEDNSALLPTKRFIKGMCSSGSELLE